MMWRIVVAALAAAGLAGLGSEPALAHHPMGGAMPTTFLHGLLSGVGHPVIGPDHLAFILAMGIAAAFVPGGLVVGLGFVAASSAGVLVHAMGVTLPLAELMVALSVVAAGATFALRLAQRPMAWIGLAILAGLAHGYAFGETVVGAERGVIGAYLLGLAVVTMAIVAGVSFAARWIGAAGEAAQPRLRLAGWAFVGVGAVLSVLALLPAA